MVKKTSPFSPQIFEMEDNSDPATPVQITDYITHAFYQDYYHLGIDERFPRENITIIRFLDID